MSEGTINIGDLVITRTYAKEIVGVVTAVKEHDTGMDIYDVYYVDWFDRKSKYKRTIPKPAYPYEAKDLVLYRGRI